MSDQIRAYVDRILRLKEEAKDINRDIREVYAEAKGNGFDKTILGKLVNYIEKREAGAAELQESEALFELYLSAYDGVGTVGATHTHEAISSPVNDSGQGEADGAFRPGNRHSVPSARNTAEEPNEVRVAQVEAGSLPPVPVSNPAPATNPVSVSPAADARDLGGVASSSKPTQVAPPNVAHGHTSSGDAA